MSRRPPLALAFAVTLGVGLTGCVSEIAGFSCADDTACLAGRACVDHACAKSDSSCGSGYRWDDSAGSRSSQCAAYADLRFDVDMPIDPNCGNGKIDPGELCDPGVGSPVPCPTLAQCDDRQSCTRDFLAGDRCSLQCVHDYMGLDNGAKCSEPPDGGVNGECNAHVCCTGCVAGAFCQSGKTVTECGASGGMCSDCSQLDGGTECTAPACKMSGSCHNKAIADGTTCTGGVCDDGQCCKGCLAAAGDGGVTCQPGNLATACGSGGVTCTSCPNGGQCGLVSGNHVCLGCTGSCGMKVCGNDGCGGSCGICLPTQDCLGGLCVCRLSIEGSDEQCQNNLDDDCDTKQDCADSECATFRCAPSGRFCRNLNCAAACRIGGQIYTDGTINPADPCQRCTASSNDSGWSPVGEGTSCNNGAPGTCHLGKCCTGCWLPGINSCIDVGAQRPEFCGNSGSDCQACDTGKECQTYTCEQGTCVGAQAPDGTLCNAICAGLGGKCICPLDSGGCLTGDTCKSGSCSGEITHQCCGRFETCCESGVGSAYCSFGCLQ